eukprot:COSAG01_NODE_2725_length_7180_cov_2.210705_2_plen_86_part_00
MLYRPLLRRCSAPLSLPAAEPMPVQSDTMEQHVSNVEAVVGRLQQWRGGGGASGGGAAAGSGDAAAGTASSSSRQSAGARQFKPY